FPTSTRRSRRRFRRGRDASGSGLVLPSIWRYPPPGYFSVRAQILLIIRGFLKTTVQKNAGKERFCARNVPLKAKIAVQKADGCRFLAPHVCTRRGWIGSQVESG